jgi:hypothetical protein
MSQSRSLDCATVRNLREAIGEAIRRLDCVAKRIAAVRLRLRER